MGRFRPLADVQRFVPGGQSRSITLGLAEGAPNQMARQQVKRRDRKHNREADQAGMKRTSFRLAIVPATKKHAEGNEISDDKSGQRDAES